MENADGQKRVLLQGNEAIAYGALAAGCNFFAGYPITPATEISEVLSEKLPQEGGTFIQMEDEIASMGAIVGASLAGAKAMTATSGPGFSLIQENLGYACITEAPCVVVNVMRGGPSTGLPTCVAQGDVQMARWGTHGDHPIVVLSVSSVSECFSITVKAFNIAEKFRTPVIILSDEVVGHTRESVNLPSPEELLIFDRIAPTVPSDWYKPYANNNRSVPDMASFGDGYRHHVTGLVHDEKGFPTQKPQEVKQFLTRIHEKITKGFSEIVLHKAFEMEDAEICVIAYGSVSRSAQRAVKEARQQGVKAGLIQLVTLFPFPRRVVDAALRQCRTVIVPEMNFGQISREVSRVNPGDARVVKLNKVDGTLITPEEILHKLVNLQ
ncbi:2-oxoacid:acceptor oxidoreductase subunit alpha [Desulfotalea psychrophila]|uniref:Probable 2-ketoglutarate oxidoreductase, alpha chain n=1 Tax=Desulfotalea psychrophila (strain LSv54 / DSM 12343) TaxID=177439 RepID=Q6AKS5_DESPS|nr:2-oxoacid:acceptor oxidoreductase subunit alpha [Desulfotalea psychrophila]CAG37050.1 probable 2-ketoglutarate oxidoreductase, alpha chain [Desulfotalea psychrophila LSv54]